jgi:hypothetical protein
MSGNGAFENEMSEVALFENALRAAVPTRPDPRLGVTLVPRLAEAARVATIEAESHATRRRPAAPRSRLALVARVGIAVALIPLVLTGLAFAGVTVPGPARSAFDSVGITLPNQPAKHAKATHADHPSPPAEDTVAPRTPTPKVTKGDSAAAHRHAREQHSNVHGKAKGHEQGKAIGLNGSTPPGQAKIKGTHSNAGGNSQSHGGSEHSNPNASGQGGNGGSDGGSSGNGNGNGNANGHSK